MGWKWIDETTQCWWQGNQWSITFRDFPAIPVEVTGIEETEDGTVIYGEYPEQFKPFIDDRLPLSLYTKHKEENDQEDHHVH